jgi:hypothetical protein
MMMGGLVLLLYCYYCCCWWWWWGYYYCDLFAFVDIIDERDRNVRHLIDINNKQKQAMYLPTECNHDGNGIIVVSIIRL